MRKRIIGLIFAWILLQGFVNLYSQNEGNDLPKSNFALFSEMTMKGLDELSDVVTISGKEKVYKISVINETDAKEFMLNTLKQKFSEYKFIYDKEDGYDYKVIIDDIKLSTYYSNLKTRNILGDEYFTRVLKVNFKFGVNDAGNTVKEVSKTYTDEVITDNQEYIENGEYAFMKAVLPDKPFMKKVLIPAVIVALSALTTILFFTIRSK